MILLIILITYEYNNDDDENWRWWWYLLSYYHRRQQQSHHHSHQDDDVVVVVVVVVNDEWTIITVDVHRPQQSSYLVNIWMMSIQWMKMKTKRYIVVVVVVNNQIILHSSQLSLSLSGVVTVFLLSLYGVGRGVFLVLLFGVLLWMSSSSFGWCRVSSSFFIHIHRPTVAHQAGLKITTVFFNKK